MQITFKLVFSMFECYFPSKIFLYVGDNVPTIKRFDVSVKSYDFKHNTKNDVESSDCLVMISKYCVHFHELYHFLYICVTCIYYHDLNIKKKMDLSGAQSELAGAQEQESFIADIQTRYDCVFIYWGRCRSHVLMTNKSNVKFWFFFHMLIKNFIQEFVALINRKY